MVAATRDKIGLVESRAACGLGVEVLGF
jgi:hypothetical protein